MNNRTRQPLLRVLHVAESMGTGVLQVVKTLAEEHDSAGVDVAVAHGTRPETPPDLKTLLPDGVGLFPLPWARRRPVDQLRALIALRRVVRSFDPDVVHLHSTFAAAVGMMAVRGRKPTIVTPHAFASTMGNLPWWSRPAVRAVEAELVRRSAIVGAVSHSEAAFARETLGATRVTVIENGIPELDPENLVVRATYTSPRPRVMAGGRIAPQRQPELVAEILDGVRDIADVEWVGAAPPGSSNDRPLVERQISISGWVSREETMGRLAEADVYLHYTAWDGQAVSLLEALAADVAVVASDIPPAREVLPPCALATSAPDAIRRIRQLLLDPATSARHHAAQHARRSQYGAARMAERWLATYEDTIAGVIRGRDRDNIVSAQSEEIWNQTSA